MHGQIVGITSSYIDDSENLNFAVSSDDVLSVLVGSHSSLKDVQGIFNSSSGNSSSGKDTLETASLSQLASSGIIGLKKYKLLADIPDNLSVDLTESDLREAVASALDSTGVTLVGSASDADAVLQLSVSAMQIKDTDGNVTGYAGSVDINVDADSLILRPDGQVNHVTSMPYHDGIVFVSGTDDLREQTVQVTKSVIDDFVKEYDSANP
jgi:hypothetical protein